MLLDVVISREVDTWSILIYVQESSNTRYRSGESEEEIWRRSFVWIAPPTTRSPSCLHPHHLNPIPPFFSPQPLLWFIPLICSLRVRVCTAHITHIFVCLYVCLVDCLFACSFVCLFVCLFVCFHCVYLRRRGFLVLWRVPIYRQTGVRSSLLSAFSSSSTPCHSIITLLLKTEFHSKSYEAKRNGSDCGLIDNLAGGTG